MKYTAKTIAIDTWIRLSRARTQIRNRSDERTLDRRSDDKLTNATTHVAIWPVKPCSTTSLTTGRVSYTGRFKNVNLFTNTRSYNFHDRRYHL